MSAKDHVAVREVMTKSPLVIDGLASVAQAAAMMREKGVSSLVVDKRDDRDEYGILAIHDIASEVVAHNRAADRVNVYEIMSKPVISVDVDMNVKYAVRLLTRFNLTRALVLESGHVAGIVTLRDLVLRTLS
jgi:signal-transduction protein with cAMP-binding, CBS, and nucleotidyltransferase domain